MEKQDAIALFHSMHPNFFEMECIKSLSEDWTFDEMFLRLDKFDVSKYEKELDTSITFGFFDGEGRVFCGYLDGKVVSFCRVENMGTYNINGQVLKIGGPGCVGTLPEYRDKGIGLMMVKKATQILKEEGYDMQIFDLNEMLEMQKTLQEKYKDKWEPLSPELGKNQLLWMISEIGEVIDIIKKHGGTKASTDVVLRKNLVEEMADVLMFYNDVLLCYGITADELKQAYTEKFEKNMRRW